MQEHPIYDPLSRETLQQRITLHHKDQVRARQAQKGQDPRVKPLSVMVICDSVLICSIVVEPGVGHVFDIRDMSDITQCDYPPSRLGFPYKLKNYLRSIITKTLLH